MGASGVDDSQERVGARGAVSGSPVRRAVHVLRFADGGELELGRKTAVMGVVNVTPDSFSDGGCHLTADDALRAAARMAQQGAQLVDVGGESSRPGAASIDAEEETRRILPAIEAIKREIDLRLSIDTTKAAVARRAFDAGADMLNDVSALGDPEMLPLVCQRRTPVVLMHMRGSPATMQDDTDYDDLLLELTEFLHDRSAQAVACGVADDKILVDPGLGFGKSAAGNLAILKRLSALAAVGKPLVVGASRKRFIGAVLDLPVDDRLEGSLAVAAWAGAQGAHIIRAHDVAATVRVVRMIDAIRDA